MSRLNRLWYSLGLLLMGNGAMSQVASNLPNPATAPVAADTNTFLGLSTNGVAIYQNYRVTRPWRSPFPTNAWAVITNPTLMRLRAAHSTRTNQAFTAYTNRVFAGFRPDSLNYLVRTNFIAHTNGCTMQIWSHRTHPFGWPLNAPVVRWNSNSLVWGLKGMTALSPCWAGEGNSGQVPITLLTRRHGYTRGHAMGPEGFNTRSLGAKVWFLAADNALVTVHIQRAVVRAGRQGDYTIFLFDRDLPDSIQPIRVAALAEVRARYLSADPGGGYCPLFKTEQGGNVSAEVPGFTVATWKGGDSGSPNLLPLPGELVFFSGRSTSGPSPEMQADMDALSQLEGLSPNSYQLQWVDLAKYPR